jgi:hypothetical protein
MSRFDLTQTVYGCKGCNKIYSYEQTGKNEICKKCGTVTTKIDYTIKYFWIWMITGFVFYWALEPILRYISPNYYYWISIGLLTILGIIAWIVYMKAYNSSIAKFKLGLNEDSPRPRP